AACGVLVLAAAYAGLLAQGQIYNAVIRGSLGNLSGIFLITPFVMLARECWCRTSSRISTLATWLDNTVESIGLSKGTINNDKITSPARPVLFLASLVACLYFVLHYSISDTFLFFCLVSIPLVFVSMPFGLHGTSVSLAAFGFIAIGKVYMGDWVG